MKTIRLIRHNSYLYAYLQIDNNIPRRFRINPKTTSQISLETAQLLFASDARINDLNQQLVQNARILSRTPLLLREYTSSCTLFGEKFMFSFPVATKAGAEDTIGNDILALFSDFTIEGDEAHYDLHSRANHVRNELYLFRKYEGTNILETMDDYYSELSKNDFSMRPYLSDSMVQMMDMALDNAILYHHDFKQAEFELIMMKIERLFYRKIEFDCNFATRFLYTPSGKFLYLKAMSYMARNRDRETFSYLLRASAFFTPESPFATRIHSALRYQLKLTIN